MTAVRDTRTPPDVFDDEDVLLPLAEHAPYAALRLPDGRALAWAEYGSPRGLPCVLVPDVNSSRLAPGWLLHDSALPGVIRLLTVDPPGIGASDPIGFGGFENPAEDLRRLVETLAVGRVTLIGIGQGADDAFAFAARYPAMVASVSGVSIRLPRETRRGHRVLRSLRGRREQLPWDGPLSSWIRTAGPDADLTAEQTWARMLPRLDVMSAEVLADRWKEQDFRAAIAADTAQINGAWTEPVRAAGPPEWVADPESVTVPVQLWHGKHETGTTLTDVLEFTDPLPLWSVTSTGGSSAILGNWTAILLAAADTFNHPIRG
jgi:pimeloyl-ACP methyl ester carboxylesterase